MVSCDKINLYIFLGLIVRLGKRINRFRFFIRIFIFYKGIVNNFFCYFGGGFRFFLILMSLISVMNFFIIFYDSRSICIFRVY